MGNRGPRRLQHRSCDQCRKGKRACDANVRRDLNGTRVTTSVAAPPSSNVAPHNNHRPGINVPAIEPCSNCRKWQRECTFNWLLSPTEPSRKKTKLSHKEQQLGQEKESAIEGGGAGSSTLPPDSTPAFPVPPQTELFNEQSVGPESNDSFAALSAWADELVFSDLAGVDAAVNAPWYGEPQLVTPPPSNEGRSSTSLISNHSDDLFSFLGNSTLSAKVNIQPHWYHRQQRDSSSSSERPDLSHLNGILPHGSGRDHHRSQRTSTSQPTPLSFFSQKLVDDFFRAETARNLLRVYHDSIENALTCWLTERNCPYTMVAAPKRRGGGSFRAKVTISIDGEWGANWSNRICARVCRLDKAYSAVRGRDLTVKEEQIASRALHAAIMAFAAQWSPESIAKVEVSGNSPSNSHNSQRKSFERSVAGRLWNEAFHVLHEAAGMESFRVIFAHLIFSFAQRPLDGQTQVHTPSSLSTDDLSQKISGLAELRELFDRDPAPLFLEAGIRQLFSCRHKLTRLQRQGDPRAESLTAEDHNTFNMLFWLAVMMDTLTAAMYQRPPVVSDEDSSIDCAVVPRTRPLQTGIKREHRVDLDGWDFERGLNDLREEAPHVWGDLFLHEQVAAEVAEWSPPEKGITRWPCSYEEAAEILSDSAPAKVLLFRRVSRLQTLMYRGAGPKEIEEAIRDTFRVYDGWNRTYGLFMLDCVAYHDNLPPRIQSWYVVVDGHWHLATFLLADTIESIDKARMGLEVNRESRRATNAVSKLRKENAVAVSRLAQSSLRCGISLGEGVEFHDVVQKDGAFLTEPWTAVLIHSFARAGYALLDSASTGTSARASPFEKEDLQQCLYCIDALWALGKKSEVASVAARSLSNSFDGTMLQLHAIL